MVQQRAGCDSRGWLDDGRPIRGRWRLVGGGQRKYTFTWPEPTDTVAISPDQRSLKGSKSIWISNVGDARLRKWRPRWNLGLVERRTAHRISGWHIFGGDVSREMASGGCVARDLYALTWPNPALIASRSPQTERWFPGIINMAWQFRA